MRRAPSVRARVTVAATAVVAVCLALVAVLTVATFASRERSSVDRDLRQRAQGPIRRVGILPGQSLQPFGEPGGPGGDGPPGAGGGPLPGGRGAGGPPPGRRDPRAAGGRAGGGRPGARAGAGPPPAPPPLTSGTDSFARVLQGGRVLAQTGDVPGGLATPSVTGLDTVRADGGRWRTLTFAPEGGRPGGRLVQLGTDLDPVDDRIGEMRTRVIVIALGGVLLAAALARWLAAVALRPLSRLREAAASVSTTRDLSRRLPESGAGAEVDGVAGSVNAMLGRLERSTTELEQALEATRRFAADVGHELRTPLTSIRANFDALARNPRMPDDERRAVVAELEAEQDELVGLLDGLQALARGEAGAALPMEEVDLAELVDAAVEAARRRHPETAVELDGPAGRLPLRGWPDGLRLLADNLVENAARHGGGTVRVALSARDGAIGLAVDDDGPGVPEDERERIFERFARGSGARAPGSGLGLALVRQQAALHGGAVDVADSPLGGARFAVSLPRERPG
ncbi:MAG TPA: HAMP domain-containing sensor histidine kinase [Thermoleophilaceae bacterium]